MRLSKPFRHRCSLVKYSLLVGRWFPGEICLLEIMRGDWCSAAEPAGTSFVRLLDVDCCRGDIPSAFPHVTVVGHGAIRLEFPREKRWRGRA